MCGIESTTPAQACLRCGWCCEHMSPISNPEPCPHLSYEGDTAVCAIYENRPEQCRKETMGGAKECPIGLGMRKKQDATEVQHVPS